jgi:hypothetical protein
MRFVIILIITLVVFFAFAPTARAATRSELEACKSASDPTDCFLTLKQACAVGDEDCINSIDLVWARWQAEAEHAEAERLRRQLEAAEKPAQTSASSPPTEPAPPSSSEAGGNEGETRVPPGLPFGAMPVGMTMAYRPDFLMAHCSQCVRLRTDGQMLLLRLDDEPVPIVYGRGRSQTVLVDYGDGTFRLEAVVPAGLTGDIYIMGSMGGAVVSWTVLQPDLLRPGVYVPGPCRHVHTHPATTDRPKRAVATAGPVCH